MNYTCGTQTADNSSFGIVSGYSGIPQNLILNWIYFGIALLIFLFVRRHIRDQDHDPTRKSVYSYITHPKTIADLNIRDLNPLTVIWKTINISLNEVGTKCGHDASKYLFFQLHIILYSIVLCILSIGILLPLNFQGTLHTNRSYFGFSTISNLPAGSDYLWGSIVVNAVSSVFGIVVMLHFVYAGDITSKDRRSKTALIFEKVPIQYCSVDEMSKILRTLLPNEPIKDIAIAYDIWRLNKLVEKGERLKLIVKGCESLENDVGHAGTVYHCCCGYYFAKSTCQRCKNIKQSDASVFYRRQLDKQNEFIRTIAQDSLSRPTGIVFVEFDNEYSAARAHELLACTNIINYWRQKRKAKKLSNETAVTISEDEEEVKMEDISKYKAWDVRFAPKKDNIFWQNVAPKRFRWYFRVIVLNTALIWLCLLLTTPSIILNVIDKALSEALKLTGQSAFGVFIVNVLPPLILKLVSKVLPPVIGHSSQLERHLTRSRKAKSHIHKSFNFLLFTVLIIPSLGLTGINGLLQWIFDVSSQQGGSFQWQCIFLPDNGAFYVNYVITSALIGTSSSLLRIPELISLGLNLLFSRSKPEQWAIYQLERTEFTYCSGYASLLVTFAVVCTYSMICPLITVFGVLYFVISYHVDKYNIYFVAAPTLVKQRIHLSAYRCSTTCLLAPQIILLIFMAIKTTRTDQSQLITQATISAIFMLIWLIQRVFGHERLLKGVVSPLIAQVPSVDVDFDGAKVVQFKRYYPNYLLPYVDEMDLLGSTKQLSDEPNDGADGMDS